MKQREMYDGRYVCTFEEGGHKYTMLDRKTQREWVPGSITGRLGVLSKPGLLPWACKLAAESGNWDESNKTRDAAAARGTEVHNEIERFLTTAILEGDWTDQLSEVATAPCESFLDWANDEGLDKDDDDLMLTEELVYSETLDTCGQVDLVCHPEGRRYLQCVDYKTSSRIYPTHMVQVGFYVSALVEEGIIPGAQRGVLHLRDKGYTYWDEDKIYAKVGSLAQTQRVVEACVAIQKWQRAGKGRT